MGHSDRLDDTSFGPEHVHKADEGLLSDRNAAKDEFGNFVKATWRELVLMGKAEAGGPVTLSVFCRLIN